MTYTFQNMLYENKFSQIWLAIGKNKQKYAIKIINLEKYDPDRILEEINFLKSINHPNIIKYYENFKKDQNIYIVMELAKCSLLDILKIKYSGFEEKYVSVILRQVLEAVQELHNNKIIHRDIKAANILVSTKNTIKLTDFGVSAKLSKYEPTRTTFVGTICWMAPEILIQNNVGYDERADIWSIGITALELIFGVPPGHTQTPMKRALNILNDDPPDPNAESKIWNKKISRKFKKFVNACLKKDPSKRPSIEKLLKHSFIKKYKKENNDIIRELLES